MVLAGNAQEIRLIWGSDTQFLWSQNNCFIVMNYPSTSFTCTLNLIPLSLHSNSFLAIIPSFLPSPPKDNPSLSFARSMSSCSKSWEFSGYISGIIGPNLMISRQIFWDQRPLLGSKPKFPETSVQISEDLWPNITIPGANLMGTWQGWEQPRQDLCWIIGSTETCKFCWFLETSGIPQIPSDAIVICGSKQDTKIGMNGLQVPYRHDLRGNRHRRALGAGRGKEPGT